MVKKGFQQTEIGIIPNDWILKKIKDFTDVTSGGTPSTFVPEYWNGEIRWMNSGEINLKKIYEVNGRITKLGLKNSSTKLIPKNCILIALAGQGKTRGTVAINHVELCINQSLGAIIPNKSFVPEYLYHNLDSRYDEFRNLSSGGEGRGGLNLTLIKNIHIPLPISIEEQKLIAKNLNDVDQVIEKFEKLIEKKKNIKQGAMQELLTGKKRLKGFNEKWEKKSLAEIAEFFSGGTPRTSISEYYKGNIPWITSGDLNQRTITEVGGRITMKGLKHSSAKMIDENTLLIALYGATAGVVAISLIKSAINQAVLAIIPHSADKIFMFHKLEYLKTRIISTYTQGGQPNLSGKIIQSIELEFPSYPEQEAIAKILSDMDLEIKELEKNRDKYLMIKNGMMQKLLTGEIRLV